MIEQRVTLRYGAQQIPAIVQAVQGDTGRDVIFELADYEIPAGATANYYIDKPDGNAVYNSAEVISSTEILAHLTEQALAVPGRNNGQVRILADDEVITSFDFVLEVEVFRGILRLQSETEVNIFDEALQDAAEDAIAEIQAQTPVVTGMQSSIAPTYSSSSTYAVGDYVMYNAQLYRCITAITTAEAWTAAHWTQVPLATDASDLKSALEQIAADGMIYAVDSAQLGYWDIDGVHYTNTGLCCSNDWITAGYDYIISAATGKEFLLIIYGAGGNTSTGWLKNPYSVSEGTKYKINFRANPSQGNIDCVRAFIKDFYKTTTITDTAEDVAKNRHNIILNQQQTVLLAQYGIMPLTVDVELGSVDGNGIKQNSTSRIRSKSLVSYPYDITIKCASPYNFALVIKNGSSYSATSWVQTYSVSANTEFYFVGRKSPEADISDIISFTSNFGIGQYAFDLNTKIENVDTASVTSDNLLQQQAFISSQYGTFPVTTNVELGSYNSSGGKTNSTSRIRSKILISYPYDITVKCVAPYSLLLLIKNGSSYIDTGWVQSYTVSANTEFLFVGRKLPETDISDPVGFSANFHLCSYIKDTLDTLNEKSGRMDQLYITSEIIGVAHRGLSSSAPQNTSPAFILAQKNGFEWIETDLRWTSDNVCVLVHDSYINRVARNPDGTEIPEEVYVEASTYDELLEYDYDVVDGEVVEAYSGNKLLTIEQGIILWKKLGLKVFFDLKNGNLITASNLQAVVDLVKKYNFEDSVIYGSYAALYLNRVLPYVTRPRMVLSVDPEIEGHWDTQIAAILELQSQGVEMYLGIYYNDITNDRIAWSVAHNVPLWVYTVNDEQIMQNLTPVSTFVLSDNINATSYYREQLYNTLPVNG